MAETHESKYKEEDNWGENKDCGSSEFSGVKTSQREQIFCKPLTCKDDVTIEPERITVGGHTFTPQNVTLVTDIRAGAAVKQTYLLLVAES